MKKNIIAAAFALTTVPFMSTAAEIGTPVQASTTVTFLSGQVTSHTLDSVASLGSGPLSAGLIIATGEVVSESPNIGLAFNTTTADPDGTDVFGNNNPANTITVMLTDTSGFRQVVDGDYAVFDNSSSPLEYHVALNGDQTVPADTYDIVVNAIGWTI